MAGKDGNPLGNRVTLARQAVRQAAAPRSRPRQVGKQSYLRALAVRVGHNCHGGDGKREIARAASIQPGSAFNKRLQPKADWRDLYMLAV